MSLEVLKETWAAYGRSMLDGEMSEGKTNLERRAILGLMLVNVVVVPLCVYFFSTKITNELAAAKTVLSEKSVELTELQIQDLRLSSDAQRTIILSNSIEARERVLSVVERTIPVIDVSISVFENTSNYAALFKVSNESEVPVSCDDPVVGLYRGRDNDNPEDPNLFADATTLPIGFLAPNSDYRTTWVTGNKEGEYWFNISVECRPFEFRTTAVKRMATEAAVNIEAVDFVFSLSVWSSSTSAQ